MKLIKLLWYSMLCDCHIKKAKKIGTKYRVAQSYHYEMSKYYFKKAYGRECGSDK